MLVLNRKAKEKVAIEGGITVSVLAIEGGRVRLGVAAPDDVRILRGELANRAEVASSASSDRPVGATDPTTI
jgi:carbon storage regulator